MRQDELVIYSLGEFTRAKRPDPSKRVEHHLTLEEAILYSVHYARFNRGSRSVHIDACEGGYRVVIIDV